MIFKKIIICFLTFIFLCNCSSVGPKPVTALDNVLEQFQEITSIPPPVPLESVNLPTFSAPPNEDGYYVFRLDAGTNAPFNGILLSDMAAAFILTEHQAMFERFTLALQQQLEIDLARLIRDRDELYLQINTDRARFRLILTTQQRHIEDLNNIVENKNNNFWEKFWLITGGLGTGLLIGIITGFFVAQ